MILQRLGSVLPGAKNRLGETQKMSLPVPITTTRPTRKIATMIQRRIFNKAGS
jgi:hypothetical protein